MAHVDAPKINHLNMIDPHRLEIYWDQDVIHKNISKDYQIKIHGENAIFVENNSTSDENWKARPIFEKDKKRVTLYLVNPISKSDLGDISISIIGDIRNSYGDVANKRSVYKVRHFQNFYSLFTKTNTGILIKSSHKVSREAHRKASMIIDAQLQKIPIIAKVMVEMNSSLAIYGREENVYEIPEHRGGADLLDRPVEGFGGVPDNPTTSISEKNVLRIMEGPNQTRYLNECILVHEFSHAIHLIGINNLPDKTLANELIDCYENAKEKGLWPKTYIISNYEEYFATLSTIWFNVMAESQNGSWDGVRGPINTREELKHYDSKGYEFFTKIYDPIALPYPWNETPILFPYSQDEIIART